MALVNDSVKGVLRPSVGSVRRLALAALGVQGVIGYVQYFSHLPAGLVWVHVAMAVILWILVLRLCLPTGTRGPAADAGSRNRPA